MREIFKENTYYLVRHGEAENNVLGVLNATEKGEYALTARGKEQAQAVAKFLTTKPIDFLVASPLLRARETAEMLRDTLDKPLSVDMRLCEPQFGPFEEKSIASFLDFMQEHGGRTAGDPELHIEGFMDIRERVQSFLETFNETFQGRHVVIVSHMDTLQELYAELMGEPVGSEQGEKIHGWSPRNGSCLIVSAAHPVEFFVPTID